MKKLSPSMTPEYYSWKAMMKRCYKEITERYPNYGGRGITVCDRWHTYSNFLEDMGTRPDGMSLDRIDNDGNYEPSNCRWANRNQQMRNTSRAIKINGVSLADLAEITGLTRHTLKTRLDRGWPIEKITAPRYTRLNPGTSKMSKYRHKKKCIEAEDAKQKLMAVPK